MLPFSASFISGMLMLLAATGSLGSTCYKIVTPTNAQHSCELHGYTTILDLGICNEALSFAQASVICWMGHSSFNTFLNALARAPPSGGRQPVQLGLKFV